MRTILSAIVLLLYVATEGMAQNISFKTEELKHTAWESTLQTALTYQPWADYRTCLMRASHECRTCY